MKTILLADDDPLLIDAYSKKMLAAGFKVKIAQTGGEALTRLGEEKFDLLLLDIVMPEISGWDIMRKIQGNNNLKDLKIIITSNLGLRSDVERGLKMGAAKYLVKAHYTPSQIIQEIQKVLG